MPSPSRRIVLAALLVLAVVSAGLLASREFHHASRVESALDTLPSQTLIANFTDWAAIRAQLGPDLSSHSPSHLRQTLFSQAYDRDFTTTSVLNVFDADMAKTYGWTVLDSEWEMYGQSKDGAVDVLRMPDDFDFGRADTTLATLGYAKPDDHGVRIADDQTLASIADGLTPQLTAVAVLADDHLIVMSDAAAYADLAVDTVHGDKDSVLGQDGVPDVAAATADSSVSALIDIGDYACTATSFHDADPAQQQLAAQRIDAVGGVARTGGLARSIDAAGRLTVVIDFDSPSTAEAQLEPRTALAKGEAPDQGGSFDERFRIDTAQADGEVVVLVLSPRSSDTQLLRDLGRGGLLFASC